MKRFIIIITILISIALLILLINALNSEEEKTSFESEMTKEQQDEITNQIEDVEKNNEVIEDIKKQTGLEADDNLYQVDTEYDGRKVLNIKNNVQFKVAFAGLIKKDKPKLDEVESIINNNYPKRNGIWVEQDSRKKVIELLEDNTESKYKIDEEGYLLVENIDKQNKNDIELQKMIKGNKTIIISVSSSYYEVDTVTGEIVEYPFEKLDYYQAVEKVENENNIIIFITTNTKKKLTNIEILKEVLR